MEDPCVCAVSLRQPQIVCRGKSDGPTDIERRAGTEDDSSRIHQKQIRTGITQSVDGSQNAGWIAIGDAAENVGRRDQRRRIQKPRCFNSSQTEFPKTVEQVGAILESCASSDFVDVPREGDVGT